MTRFVHWVVHTGRRPRGPVVRLNVSDCLYGAKYFVRSGTYCNVPIVVKLTLLCESDGSLRLRNVVVEAC